MQEIAQVRCNYLCYFDQNGETPKFVSQAEIVFVHSAGHEYVMGADKSILSSPKIEESRFVINIGNLELLIKDLNIVLANMDNIQESLNLLNEGYAKAKGITKQETKEITLSDISQKFGHEVTNYILDSIENELIEKGYNFASKQDFYTFVFNYVSSKKVGDSYEYYLNKTKETKEGTYICALYL